MKKICTVCGMGLGSSLIVEINTKKALEELNVSEDDFEITHKSLNSYSASEGFDYVICGADLADSIDPGNGLKIVLKNIVDPGEIREKLREILNK